VSQIDLNLGLVVYSIFALGIHKIYPNFVLKLASNKSETLSTTALNSLLETAVKKFAITYSKIHLKQSEIYNVE
jgi:hypothetical protein